MKKFIILLAIIFSSVSLSAQTIGNQTAIQVKTAPSGGWQYALLSLPENYEKETDRYPLLLFFHGIGELGKTTTDLSKLNNQGLPNLISKGLKVQAVNPIDKKNYKFIVVSPQHHGWTTTAYALQYIIKDLSSKYRIDTTRIYLTGLSAGGQGVIQDVTYTQELTNSIAAIVPMSPSAPTDEVLKNFTFFKQSKTFAWFFSGSTDGNYTINAKKYNDSINKYNPGGSKITVYPGGHCCWTTYYDPSYREDGKNIYEWMLQYQTGKTGVIIPPNQGNEEIPIVDSGKVMYKYYEGSYSKLPDFSKLTPKRIGKSVGFNIETVSSKDNFAMVFESYIKVDEPGSYVFGTSSDDGSKLFIDTSVIVDNDGLHSMTYKEGSVSLNKGVYKIIVQYFEGSGDNKLEVYWKPVGKTTKELLPQSILVDKPLPPPSGNAKEVGRFKFLDTEVILYDNLTWEYIELLN